MPRLCYILLVVLFLLMVPTSCILFSDKFHHHRDLWRLDTTTNVWEEIRSKGGPSARSGHRMVIWRNSIILFGGFFEAFRQNMWFADLFIFSIPTQTWRKVEFPATAPQPGARSGHQLLVNEDTLIVNGGYTKFKANKKTQVQACAKAKGTFDIFPEAFEDVFLFRTGTSEP